MSNFDASKAKAASVDAIRASLKTEGDDSSLWKVGISPVEGANRPTGKRTVAGVVSTHLPYLRDKKGVSQAVIDQATQNLSKAIDAAKAARTPAKATATSSAA